MDTLPSVFVSHGSPMIALQPGAAGTFLRRLGPAVDASFGRPRAILTLSAHSTADGAVLLAAQRHEAVHDFGGFPAELHRLRYDVAGAPALAGQVARQLQAAGIAVQLSPAGGLDHGIWTVLRHAWPQAQVPVLPLAWNAAAGPAALWALGEALAPLRAQGVLVMGSGSITHNLGRVFGARGSMPAVDAPEAADSAAFRAWFAAQAAAGERGALLDYRRQAPHAAAMHPSDEHLLPWFVAAGAGGLPGLRLHEGVTHGCLGMDAYAFGPEAATLQRTLEG